MDTGIQAEIPGLADQPLPHEDLEHPTIPGCLGKNLGNVNDVGSC